MTNDQSICNLLCDIPTSFVNSFEDKMHPIQLYESMLQIWKLLQMFIILSLPSLNLLYLNIFFCYILCLKCYLHHQEEIITMLLINLELIILKNMYSVIVLCTLWLFLFIKLYIGFYITQSNTHETIFRFAHFNFHLFIQLIQSGTYVFAIFKHNY